MSYSIIKDLIPGIPRIPFRNGIGEYEGVVAHATDDYEATAKNIRDFESRNWKNAFVQFAVDWAEIRQIADTNYEAYGAGPVANKRFVHVELCQTRDPERFKESYARYVWLLAYLLKQKRLSVKFRHTLWGHDDIRQVLGGTTHTDPWDYLASHGVSKEQLIEDVKNAYEGKGDELTMSQYQELKNQIDDLNKKIDTLSGEGSTPDDYAEKAIEWAQDKGISTGKRPQGTTKREEVITMIWNYHEKFGCCQCCKKGN